MQSQERRAEVDVYKDGERGRDGGSEGKLNERSGGCIWTAALENE